MSLSRQYSLHIPGHKISRTIFLFWFLKRSFRFGRRGLFFGGRGGLFWGGRSRFRCVLFRLLFYFLLFFLVLCALWDRVTGGIHFLVIVIELIAMGTASSAPRFAPRNVAAKLKVGHARVSALFVFVNVRGRGGIVVTGHGTSGQASPGRTFFLNAIRDEGVIVFAVDVAQVLAFQAWPSAGVVRAKARGVNGGGAGENGQEQGLEDDHLVDRIGFGLWGLGVGLALYRYRNCWVVVRWRAYCLIGLGVTELADRTVLIGGRHDLQR